MITFDGFNLADYVDKIADIRRPIMASREQTLFIAPGADGATLARSRSGVKEIEVEVLIFGQTKTEIREKVNALAGVLFTDGLADMVFSDEPYKTYRAIVTNETAFEELSVLGRGQITFLCPDGSERGEQQTKALVNNGTTAVSVGGTAKTWPVFNVTFQASAEYYDFYVGNQKMAVNFPFIAGSTLTVDHAKNLVTINGTPNNQAITLESDFFPLQPGTVSIRTDPPGSAAATVSVTYDERWL